MRGLRLELLINPRWIAIAWIWCALVLAPGVDAQEVVIHPSQNESRITRNALRAMFGMRLRTWPDGTPIRVFVLREDSSTHKAFAKRILQIFPHQLSRAWDRLVFSGTGQAPQVVQSPEEMLAKVASTPGAIGYLPPESIDERVQRVGINGS